MRQLHVGRLLRIPRSHKLSLTRKGGPLLLLDANEQRQSCLRPVSAILTDLAHLLLVIGDQTAGGKSISLCGGDPCEEGVVH